MDVEQTSERNLRRSLDSAAIACHRRGELAAASSRNLTGKEKTLSAGSRRQSASKSAQAAHRPKPRVDRQRSHNPSEMTDGQRRHEREIEFSKRVLSDHTMLAHQDGKRSADTMEGPKAKEPATKRQESGEQYHRVNDDSIGSFDLECAEPQSDAHEEHQSNTGALPCRSLVEAATPLRRIDPSFHASAARTSVADQLLSSQDSDVEAVDMHIQQDPIRYNSNGTRSSTSLGKSSSTLFDQFMPSPDSEEDLARLDVPPLMQKEPTSACEVTSKVIPISCVSSVDAVVAPTMEPSVPKNSRSGHRTFPFLDRAVLAQRQLSFLRNFRNLFSPENAQEVVKSIDKILADSTCSDRQDCLNRLKYQMNVTGKTVETTFLPVRSTAESRRAFEKFGSDRFLFVKWEPRTKRRVWFQDCDNFGKSYPPLTSLGRTYRMLTFKDKDQGDHSWGDETWDNHDREKAGSYCVTAIFFAEEGENLDKITVQEVRDWHLPWAYAWNLPVVKYWKRMELMFSKAWRTVVLQPSEIELHDDLYGTANSDGDEPILTDGCGRVSLRLMLDILRELDYQWRGLGHPIAFQGRIGPAKGMWLVDFCLAGRKLIISQKSQMKYGDSIFFENCEDLQRTVEVLRVEDPKLDSSTGKPRTAKFAYQVALILEGIGCPREAIMKIVESEIKGLERGLFDGAEAAKAILPHFETSRSDLCENISDMLKAGMVPTEDPPVFDKLTLYCKTRLERLRQSAKYDWPESHWVTIVPDFSRTLKRGQASLVLPGIGPFEGRAAIARVPCGNPTDVQVVNFVGDALLVSHHIGCEGVLVLSAHEELSRAPADFLSGGDYDGDRVLVITDPQIVESLRPVESDGLNEEDRNMLAELGLSPSRAEQTVVQFVPEEAMSHHQASEAVSAALSSVLVEEVEAAARRVHEVGMLMHWWAAKVDKADGGVNSRMPLLLNYLMGKAVDADKTGFHLSSKARAFFWGGRQVSLPQWLPKQGWRESGGSTDLRESKSIMGFLYRMLDPEKLAEQWRERFGKRLARHGINLQTYRDSLCHPSEYVAEAGVIKLWGETEDKWKSFNVFRKYRDDEFVWCWAVYECRKFWREKLKQFGIAPEVFASVAVQRNETHAWILCFSELLVNFIRNKRHGNEACKVELMRSVEEQAFDVDHVQKRRERLFLERFRQMANDSYLAAPIKEERLLVDDVFFTQSHVSSSFSCGLPLEATVQQLLDGELDGELPDCFLLRVVKVQGKYRSFNNRRLYTLKRFQQRICGVRAEAEAAKIQVRVEVLDIEDERVMAKYLMCNSTENDGYSVIVV